MHSLWKHAETTRWAHPLRRAALALHRLPSRRFTARSSNAFSGHGFADEIVTLAVRWYVRYRLSYADVAELLAEWGVMVSRSTVYRWVQRFLPLFAEAARAYCQPVGGKWRVDETYSAASMADGPTAIGRSTRMGR